MWNNADNTLRLSVGGGIERAGHVFAKQQRITRTGGFLLLSVPNAKVSPGERKL